MTEPPSSTTQPNQHATDAIGATQSVDGPDAHQINGADIVGAARYVGETLLGPNAEISDQLPGPNRPNFEALAAAGLLAIGVPREYGGVGASAATQREATQILASYCGVTTFIQAQHHGPCRMIASGPSDVLKQRLLPELARGRRMCGISFAHLRRPGPPVLRAEPCEGGYRLTGTAPWVTGWGLMDQVVFGATLPDGRFAYLWSPADRSLFPEVFADIALPSAGGALRASDPLPLCAMNASATVELQCDEWFIPEEHKLSESDRETMQRNDRSGVLGATTMPLGCAAASVRLLASIAEKRDIPAVRRAERALAAEWQELNGLIEQCIPAVAEPGFFAEAMRLRAWCIELAVRAAHAAVAAASGAANLRSHPAQRLLREAMFYTVQAQTHDVMDATLARLEARR